ncbi:MAG: chemotaxis protein CheA [Alphaproteobacteria bacterium]|nr:chemotaxis protein CheA [Alphaproteobacteria bacterium]
MVTLDRFRETYLNECAELLADMEGRLVAINVQSADVGELNAIFRCAHSIKGGAGAFGFHKTIAFTHRLETLLDKLRDGRLPVTDEAVTALIKSVDVTTAILKAESQGEAIPEDFGADLAQELDKLCGTEGQVIANPGLVEKSEGERKRETYKINFAPHDNIFMTGNDPLLILRELGKLGDMHVALHDERLPQLPNLNYGQCYLSWTIELTTDKGEAAIGEAFEFVADECDLKIEKIEKAVQDDVPRQTMNRRASDAIDVNLAVTSIRVDLEKVDRLVNMVGELVITQAMLQVQTRHLSVEQFPELLRGVDELSQHMRELQEAVMSVRMQPVKSVFSRMPRIVRDIAHQLGKDIALVMTGEATEVDKTIIELLADPLTHMIRNAADHGIERPEVRLAAGKSAQGTVHLKASHQSGQIVIEVSDDGAGLNHEKILQKARQKGLIAADAALSVDQIEQLIFLPGFSTSDQVSNISGRGVGMDVVKKNIESIGGTIQVRSEFGKSTSMTIILPLTLAILDGMIVRVGAENYIIPITSIIETLRPKPGAVHAVPDGQDVLNVRGEFIPIVYLHAVFGVANAVHDPAQALVVLVEAGSHKLGVVVDELLGQQQVVIKSLEANADPVAGISGATILGDGKVSLILDIGGVNGILDREDANHLLREAS